MKFVLFYHSLISDWNHGNAHFLRGIVSELLHRGHAVDVYEPASGWSLTNLLEEGGEAAVDDFHATFPELRSTFFDVTTLDGTKSRVTVPEGTQPGKQFRLKGKGMPVLRSAQTGDLYIQIQIETPQKLTERQRELLQEFEEISSKDNNPESTGFFARMKEFFDG